MQSPAGSNRAQIAKQLAAAAALVALAWSWKLLPALGGLGEMIAIAAPVLLAGVLAVHLVAFLVRKRIVLVISMVAWVVSGTVMIVSPRTPTDFAPPRDPVTLLAANVHFTNHSPLDAARDVVDRDADVVVISENTLRSESVLADAYPYHVRSADHGLFYSELVASRFPLRAQTAPPELLQAVVVEVMAPTPFLLVGVHLPRAGINFPHLHGKVSFEGQQRAVEAVTRLTDASRLPVVVAGDLNVSDRTAAYRRLVSGRHDAMRSGWARSTYRPFPWNFFGLRIDHVLIDRSWCAAHASRFHPSHSDHNAVQVAIGPCP
jgi:endonuclease/exonuclease/phosphatase (EEP) superfamily protein YafD